MSVTHSSEDVGSQGLAAKEHQDMQKLTSEELLKLAKVDEYTNNIINVAVIKLLQNYGNQGSPKNQHQGVRSNVVFDAPEEVREPSKVPMHKVSSEESLTLSKVKEYTGDILSNALVKVFENYGNQRSPENQHQHAYSNVSHDSPREVRNASEMHQLTREESQKKPEVKEYIDSVIRNAVVRVTGLPAPDFVVISDVSMTSRDAEKSDSSCRRTSQSEISQNFHVIEYSDDLWPDDMSDESVTSQSSSVTVNSIKSAGKSVRWDLPGEPHHTQSRKLLSPPPEKGKQKTRYQHIHNKKVKSQNGSLKSCLKGSDKCWQSDSPTTRKNSATKKSPSKSPSSKMSRRASSSAKKSSKEPPSSQKSRRGGSASSVKRNASSRNSLKRNSIGLQNIPGKGSFQKLPKDSSQRSLEKVSSPSRNSSQGSPKKSSNKLMPKDSFQRLLEKGSLQKLMPKNSSQDSLKGISSANKLLTRVSSSKNSLKSQHEEPIKQSPGTSRKQSKLFLNFRHTKSEMLSDKSKSLHVRRLSQIVTGGGLFVKLFGTNALYMAAKRHKSIHR